MDNLKPCPLCGSKAIKCVEYSPTDGYIANSWYYKVKCDSCGLMMCKSQREDVINAWNKRGDDNADRE